jgi:inosine-uridine nucleoside N-ribohydrolase
MNTTLTAASSWIGALLLFVVAWDGASSASAAEANQRRKPVILDTDIGDDIDDTWALGLLLKSPELDVKLVMGDYGKPDYRTKILAKFLQAAGRTDIPIGVGVPDNADAVGPQADWVKDYDLKSYPGKIHQDGVGALIETVLASPEPVTIVAIGPLPNLAAALKREPRIAERAVFVGMHGSVRKGYDGSNTISAEWNVRADAKSCAAVFTAPWEMLITPLDTCGIVNLDGQRYACVRDSQDVIAANIIANYRIWSTHKDKNNNVADHRSSTLFDTVAVYLAITQDLCQIERLGIRVTDDGFTRIDPAAKSIQVATQWKDLDGFRDFLVNRLTTTAGRP